MKLMKSITALLLAALLLTLLVLPAAAEDIVPPGQDERGDADEDPITPADGNADGENQPVPADDGLIWISDSMAYDETTREFVYPVSDSGTVVRASVASGMIVTGQVKLVGATLLIYKDGRAWEGDAKAITEPGEYVVMAQYGNQTPRILTFNLVGDATSTVYAYNLPAGMLVLSATRDGEEADYDRSSVTMQEEGLYHVEYECLSTGATYVLDVNVDRTPPELQFDGAIDEDHRVHSALRFSGLQEGDTISATLDGNSIEVSVQSDGTGELTQSGSYIITVFDAAGNRSEYGYTIMLYLNAGGLAFFLILIASLVALGIYIIIKRRKLEIG